MSSKPPRPDIAGATPLTPAQAMQRAAQAYGRGALPEAERLCRLILGARPDHPDALHLLGVILAGTGRLPDALEALAASVASAPDNPEALANLGAAQRALGRHGEALESEARALALRPASAATHFNRSLSLLALGRPGEALEALDRAIALRPDHPDAWNNRGIALGQLGREDEAFACYERALALRPDFPEALNNRGPLLVARRRPAEALAGYERAIALRADYTDAHYNRGNALRELKRHEAAVASFDRVLALEPGHAEAHADRAHALAELKRLPEAIAGYERALALAPDKPYLPGTWLHARLKVCAWEGLEAQFARLAGAIARGEPASMPFNTLSMPFAAATHRRAAEILVRDKFPAGPVPAAFSARARGERLRVGYFSADFFEHATARLMVDLFERHDRSRFEFTAFSFGPDTGDAMQRRVAAAFERHVDVRALPDDEVARQARALGLDIAVDLKGLTQDCRPGIFASRAAPVQASFVGYPGTMGADFIDYVIADATLIPPGAEADYTEKVAYLPESYQPNDATCPFPANPPSREELGLPAAGFVFCCFNDNYKILPEVFACWMRVLGRVEGSVLWLLEDNAQAARNLRAEAARAGLDPRRLVFAPRRPLQEHLRRHLCADLFLDTAPYNAHTTASDALWAGLPILTCPGATFASRVAASLLGAVGLPELIARSPADYESLAVALATDAGRLAALRARLEASRRTAPLFDTPRFARHLEALYVAMHERRLAGLAPDHLRVAPLPRA